MRPALPQCVSSQPVLFDFLAPRLLGTQRPRRFASVPHRLRQTSSTRYSSLGAAARTPASKPSILDVAGSPESDLSYYASQMRKYALDTDILGVWTAYRHIEHKHPRLVLGPQHYGSTSLMLVKLFSDIHSPREGSEQEMRAMEELAFVCVAAGYAEGFRQMLLWLLAREEPGKIIKAYERFEQTVLDLDESGLGRTTDSQDIVTNEDDADSPQARIENPDLSRVDVADIMAITIAAHAQLDSFQDALQLILRRTSHRVVRENILSLGRELKTFGDLKVDKLLAKTGAYAEAAGMARLVQRPEVFKAHIRNLSKEKSVVSRLENVMRILTSGFTAGKIAWAAIDDSRRSEKCPIVVTEKVWAYLLHAFIAAHKEDSAEKLWTSMLRIGYSPSNVIWNALLEGYRDIQQLQKLLDTWELMKREGIAFDAVSYGAKIACLYQARRGVLASKAFDEYKQMEPSKEDNLFVYNTVLNGHLLQNKPIEASKVLEEMKEHGPQPDVVTYNTLIAYHGKKADLRGIADAVRQLTGAGVQPDVFTFTTILSAMLKARVPNGAERLLQVMENMGVKQNVATYSAIIDSQVRKGTRSGIRAGWELLQQMERMKGMKPNVVTYTSFLAGVHRSQELDKGLITSISSDVVKTMKKRGVQLKLGTYHILFKACLENPNPEGVDFFMDYYNMMVRSGIAFWHDTWYIILNGLIRRDAWALASEMKGRMLDSEFQPMWGVLEMVKEIDEWEVENR